MRRRSRMQNLRFCRTMPFAIPAYISRRSPRPCFSCHHRPGSFIAITRPQAHCIRVEVVHRETVPTSVMFSNCEWRDKWRIIDMSNTLWAAREYSGVVAKRTRRADSHKAYRNAMETLKDKLSCFRQSTGRGLSKLTSLHRLNTSCHHSCSFRRPLLPLRTKTSISMNFTVRRIWPIRSRGEAIWAGALS